MKKVNILSALIIIIVLTGISCSQNKNKSSEADPADDEKVEIVNGQPFYLQGEQTIKTFFIDHHIDDQTRDYLKINRINYKRQSVGDSGTEDINEDAHSKLTTAANTHIARGSAFRKADKGVIRRIFLLEEFPDGFDEVTEFLVSYDNNNNYIDSKLVSRQGGFSPITYEVDGDVIHVTLREAGEDWRESYTIQPNLNLKKTHNSESEL